MNGVPLFRSNWAEVVHRLADHVHHTPQGAVANWNRNRATLIDGFHAAHHAFGCFHGNRANAALAQMLLDFKHNIDWPRHLEAIADHAKGLVNGRHGRLGELHVHCGTGDLNYVSDVFHKEALVVSGER